MQEPITSNSAPRTARLPLRTNSGTSSSAALVPAVQPELPAPRPGARIGNGGDRFPTKRRPPTALTAHHNTPPRRRARALGPAHPPHPRGSVPRTRGQQPPPHGRHAPAPPGPSAAVLPRALTDGPATQPAPPTAEPPPEPLPEGLRRRGGATGSCGAPAGRGGSCGRAPCSVGAARPRRARCDGGAARYRRGSGGSTSCGAGAAGLVVKVTKRLTKCQAL